MRAIILFLLLTNSLYAQTVNNATINIQGTNQIVNVTQSNIGHSANLQLVGDGISVNVNQSGNTPQSFSLSVTCYSNCPNSPYIVSQY